ncbi:aminotransferase class V-fold PLP-dependent enzyme [Streptomyces tubbatahanensis]|uniref:Aminotransferase class V-fold PLP-dependent enzyme n=1 Tax=Streptomyces tubbatahanensis TaxID=2923272 RepID=A0ABY3XPQ5_9ACTN|nr:aminotransferase class V-fold PLP-dependent enzyme [Streptomyces tubbatahanensis]UNS96433.1 aminotransferase class V-fold PLP-dependent enzyme [Streptomyces tubbatahanensis]
MSAFTVDGLHETAPGAEAGGEADVGLLAGGGGGPAALRPLLGTVLAALERGAVERGGPLPAGGPREVSWRVRAAAGAVLPEVGAGAGAALDALVGAVAAGAADPAEPLCAAHLHCPPLAVAAAADVAASALNPSMDSWDQAPAASTLEAMVCRELARLVFPDVEGADGAAGTDGAAGAIDAEADAGARSGPGTDALADTYTDTKTGAGAGPDALVTSGGTEANQLGLLLARQAARAVGGQVRVVCGANAHHSVHRSAWLLGLAPPLVVPTPRGVLEPEALGVALDGLEGAPALVVATAGTTDTGDVDPLAELVGVARGHGARVHVDAAYGGPLLFSERLRGRLAGLRWADSVSFDLHKLGWQPVAAGFFAVPDGAALRPLEHCADYLNADDDTEAGLPDLLGRSLRTTRRPDVLKVAVTLRALGRAGMAGLVERTCAAAVQLAELVAGTEGFELYARPALSTVVFRPVGGDDALVAGVRRRLLERGQAVLGRASLGGGLWWKVTLLNPLVAPSDLAALVKLVEEAVEEAVVKEAVAEEAVVEGADA